MHPELEANVLEYLGVDSEYGRAIIRATANSAADVFRKKSDIADFYLANEQEIKSFLHEYGEPFEDIESAVKFVFERICEEIEEKKDWLEEIRQYDEEERYDD